MKTFGLLVLAVLSLSLVLSAVESKSLYDVPLTDIDGKKTSLKAYQGKVLLVVNVASKCGLTPQYKSLESLYQKYKDQGLVVVGFPCNDFGSQEPGTESEIKDFCEKNYKVSFPMFSKLHVKGAEQHPLYAQLTGKDAAFPGDIKWNFGKFLIGRDGKVLARFEPQVKPEDPKLVEAIEGALKTK